MKKHKILTVLTLFTLVLMGVTTIIKPPTKVSAYIEPIAHTTSSDYIRILIAPDGDAKKDNWNNAGAVTAIIVLESGGAPITKGGKLKYGNSGSRHLIEHDLQYRPVSGNYSLGGPGAADYIANGNQGLKLWYFNVRYDLIAGKRFQVARMNPTVNDGEYEAWNVTEAITFSDEQITKAWKVERNKDGSWANLWFSGSIGNNMSSQTVAYVLEGYLTCSSSALNGYMAYPSLNTTYSLDGKSTNSTELTDFSNVSEYGDGRTTGSGTSITLGQKVSMMKAFYEAAQETINTTNKTTNYLNVIIVISVLGLTSLFGFYFLKKKPKSI